MKKVIFLTLAFVLIFATTSYAGFNFGSDTYEKVDNILIVNSLGDQTTESQFNYKNVKLGYNDFIPENAFKNDLYNQGYTKVFDFNNSNLDLVEVGYMGLRGDPRSYDADYVLREEYEKYSSQYQDIRIDKNKTDIKDLNIHNDYQDMRLDANKNNILQNRGNITTNKKNININKKKIKTNKSNINVNKSNIKTNKTNINSNKKEIKKVDTRHTNWNKRQDKKINTNKTGIKTNKKSIKRNTSNITNNTNNISSNSNRINDLDNRVEELEKTQYVIGGAIRIVDSKKWNVELFADYSTNRQMVDRTGIRFTYKFGESYTDKKIRELEERLDNSGL